MRAASDIWPAIRPASGADLELPMVFVTLASRAGYFRQVIDSDGRRQERPTGGIRPTVVHASSTRRSR